MAKELPYFKFEPGEWESGNIQILDFETQGIFINLCSAYWQRLGDLSYKLALHKTCKGNATALQTLCDEEIIAIRDDKIIIEFLDEQLSEFDDISEQNRQNALKGWEKRRVDATAERPHSDRNAIREDKRREEKRKEEKIEYPDGFVSVIEEWLEYKKEKRQTYKPMGLKAFITKLIELSNNNPDKAREIINQSMANNWDGIFELKNNKQDKPNNYDTDKLFD